MRNPSFRFAIRSARHRLEGRRVHPTPRATYSRSSVTFSISPVKAKGGS